MPVIDVIARQALTTEESSSGAVGVVHSGTDLEAWWIWKDDEEVEPTPAVIDREDLLYVIQGSLRLELQGRGSHVVEAGQLYVIPAGVPFRGYRWPRGGEPCLFLAVAPAGATFTRLQVSDARRRPTEAAPSTKDSLDVTARTARTPG